MLILGRREGERFRIGEDVWVTIVEVNGRKGKVRLGITGPNSTRILREELLPLGEQFDQIYKGGSHVDSAQSSGDSTGGDGCGGVSGGSGDAS